MVGLRRYKRSILSGVRKAGLFDLMRFFQRKRLIIVMYHRFTLENEPFKCNINTFEKHLKYFNKYYNIISFDSYIQSLCCKSPLPNNPLIITFDDGYYDNYTIAYPLLKKHSAAATIFISTNFVNYNEWLWSNKLEYILWNSKKPEFSFQLGSSDYLFSVEDFSSWHKSQLTIFNYLRELGSQRDSFLAELGSFLRVDVPDQTTEDFQSLDWSHVKEMQQNGITIGSHTCSHPILSSINSQDLHKEIDGSKNEIETITGKKIDYFCYPNGQSKDYNDEVVKLVEQAGYLAAVTTIPGFNYHSNTQRLLMNRCSLTTDNELEISNTFVRLP